jgi:hypothetical protein
MAFSYTITQRPVANGNKRVSMGTFDAGGDASGTIDTGMRHCEFITITIVGNGGDAQVPTVTELPTDGSAVELNFGTSTTISGLWYAIGY